jgi:uncharacterized membrane protein YbhN (UPF0104 family)
VGASLGGLLLYRAASQYTMADVAHSLGAVRWINLCLCVAFAATSYTCLTVNDWLALQYVGKPLAYRRAALAGFVGLSLGHSIGFAGLSSGPIRYRFYSRWGLNAVEVAKLMLFCGATVAMGLLCLGAIVLVAAPTMVASSLHLSVPVGRGLGLALAALVAGYLALAGSGNTGISIRGTRLALPKLHLALAQTALGTLNFACVAACLDAALASSVHVSYAQVIAAFIVGNGATLASHVPGGLGVIETAVIYLVPHRGGALLGGLVLFRLVYYLLPLLLGLTTLLLAEIHFRTDFARMVAQASQRNGSGGSTKIVPNTGEMGPSSSMSKGTRRR